MHDSSETRDTLVIALSMIVFVFAAVLIACSFLTLSQDDLLAFDADVYTADDGWSNSETGEALSVPIKLSESDGKEVSVERVFENTSGEDLYLLIKSNHQRLSAYSGDTLLFDENTEVMRVFSDEFGMASHIVCIPEEYAGTVVRIVTRSFDIGNICEINSVQCGTRSAICGAIVSESIGSAVLCICLTLIGTVFIVLAVMLLLKRKRSNGLSFFYMGLFADIAALWIFTDTQSMQFFVANKSALYFMSFLCFMLMPLAYLLYVRESCKNNTKLLDVCCFATIAGILLNVLLTIVGIAPLYETVVITHFLLVVSICCIVYVSIKELFKYKNKEFLEGFIGMSVLTVSGLISIILFYLTKYSELSIDISMIYKCGIVLFIFIQSIGTVNKTVFVLKRSAENNTFRNLAYTDFLTGLGNRMAFEENLLKIDKVWDNTACFGMLVIDIDGLKARNDNYGHASGDDLIRNIALTINFVFSERGKCYRIGGDEFTVMIEKTDEDALAQFAENFRSRIELFNMTHRFPIDASIGFAMSEENGVKCPNVYKLFNVADERMYQFKAEKKAKMTKKAVKN